MSEPFKGTVSVDIRDSVPDWSPFEPPKAPDGAPSVVYIVLDDVGFSAMSCYGGPIDTPNIDAITADGVRYQQWHTTALCSPARSCLLIAGVGVEIGIDRDRAGGRHHQRVAVGRGAGRDPRADHAGRAAAIVDHHRLAELGRKLVGDDAPDHIDAAAGRERHDQRDRFGGIVLGVNRGRIGTKQKSSRQRQQKFHTEHYTTRFSG